MAISSAAPQQPDLFHEDFGGDSRDWIPTKLLLEEMEEEAHNKRLHLLRRVGTWVTSLRIFRRTEQRRLIETTPNARDLQFHRAMLTKLLGFGEMLLLDLSEHSNIEPAHIGLTMEAITASVEELRLDLSQHYGDMTQEMRNDILNLIPSGA